MICHGLGDGNFLTRLQSPVCPRSFPSKSLLLLRLPPLFFFLLVLNQRFRVHYVLFSCCSSSSRPLPKTHFESSQFWEKKKVVSSVHTCYAPDNDNGTERRRKWLDPNFGRFWHLWKIGAVRFAIKERAWCLGSVWNREGQYYAFCQTGCGLSCQLFSSSD